MTTRVYLPALPIFLLLSVLGTALPAVGQTLPVTTDSDEARQHFELGRHAAFHYQAERAIAHLDDAIAADSGFVLAYLHRGGMSYRYQRKHYFDLARAHQDGVTAGERRMVDAFHAFLWDGEVDRAVESFRELASEYPDDPYLPTYLGLRYLRNYGRPEPAAEQFRRALARDSTFAQAHYWLGQAALGRGESEPAEEHLHAYLRGAPNHPRPYDALGELDLRAGRYDRAEARFRQAIAMDPRFEAAHDNLLRVEIARINERFEKAFGARDATALAELYASYGRLLPAGREEIRGREAIAEFFAEAFGTGATGLELETTEVYRSADDVTVTEVGRYRMMAGQEAEDVGKYMVIWAKTPDGWRIYRDMWTSDRRSDRR